MKTQKFIIIAAITCLFLGVGMAQAQTVEKDGDTVTAIRDLQIGNLIYDVEFRTESADQVYNLKADGSGNLDFITSAGALTAVLAVIVNFGKHKDKSLPQIIFKDADWFFHSYENDFFKCPQAHEAQELYRRARSIRVPPRNSQKMLVEYFFYPDGKFGTMQLIPDGPDLGRLNVASSIDFYVPRSYSFYDKTGYKNFVFALKAILFGDPSHRMNRRACEAFFNDDENFDLDRLRQL